MVTDLVHEDVGYQFAERQVAGFAPFREDRPAVEEDHRLQGRRTGEAALRQVNALVEAAEGEGIFDFHVSKDFVAGEFLHQEDDISGKGAKWGRQSREAVLRDFQEVIEAWRQAVGPVGAV